LKSSNSPHGSNELIQLGKIVGAHGIRGALRVYSYAESVENLVSQPQIILRDPEGLEVVYDLMDCRPYKKIVRMSLKNVDTRNQAEALVGCGVFIPKKALPPLEEDTFYWHDLIGMAVVSREGEALGHISEIMATGANDVYVIRTTDGGTAKEILVPAIGSVVLDIDVRRKRMVVALPDGLE
jgi:16S rRNA processing protein RimM